MMLSPWLHIVESAASHLRLREASAFLDRFPPATEVLIVGASRYRSSGPADDLARAAATRHGATFGHHRFSFTQLAAHLSAAALARQGLAPGTVLGSETVAARAAFGARQDASMAYFDPVAATPGFPRALAHTLGELRLAGVGPAALARLPLSGPDLAGLLERFEEQFRAASASDRAGLFRTATVELEAGPTRWSGLPLLLLDVPVESEAESDFLAALMRASSVVLATVPTGDERTLDALHAKAEAGRYDHDIRLTPDDSRPIRIERLTEDDESSDLGCLRRYLFETERPEPRTLTGELQVFSAPGEGRESVEIARRILEEARAGVPFDQMAILPRGPQNYVGLLEHSLRRAGIPAWFDRGTRRPDPAGRAFLALLACRIERLSANRFAEYLSLGQVPQIEGADHSPEAGGESLPAGTSDEAVEALTRVGSLDEKEKEEEDEPRVVAEGEQEAASGSAADAAIVAGALRAPWKWEELLVESAVIGGYDRWIRRLDGLAAEYDVKISELGRTEEESPRIARLRRDRENLSHLRAFALPVIETLAAWPTAARWGEWLSRFERLVPRVLRHPARVLQVIGELGPMSDIGPVSLMEARDVLADRLLALEVSPPAHRYGRVFVGSPNQARGRAFRVVFVPGLAERMFPQKLREDPMLLDELREALNSRTRGRYDRGETGSSLEPLASRPLITQDDRTIHERLLLRLAVGAASTRLYVSYPRLELAESRPRVPSFYLLDIMRAATGVVPNHQQLERAAAAASQAALDWPAPRDPARAIDDLEHDLAVLRPLVGAKDRAEARGRARYILTLNDCLRRAIITRWSRGRQQWSAADGLTRVTEGVRPALDKNRLAARPYSVSALQRFATCPYQFLLGAIHRLEPVERPEPLQRMDPLTRGSLFHRVQADFLRALDAEQALPVTRDTLGPARKLLDDTIRKVAAEYRERLAPAIDRVWQDEITALATDLRIWLARMADEADWVPWRFEFAFGLDDTGRDPRSVRDPVTIDGGFVLRGAVDLVERSRDGHVMRVTDHKTGKNRSTPQLVIGNGTVLQPVVYGLAVERLLGAPVRAGRLYYCTTAGGFHAQPVELTEPHRRAGLEALEIIDRAVELGFLPAAPAERACEWCDFRPVCGPGEERRVRGKQQEKLHDLIYLRQQP